MERGSSNLAELADALERLRAADPDAVDRLCGLLLPKVEVYVRRRLTPRGRRWAEVDDVVQGILVEIVGELGELPADAGPDELLRRVQRTAGCRVRDVARNNGRLIGESAGPAADGTPADRPRSVGPVTAEDRRRWLEELVARLPEKYAAVVRLCAFEELSCVEAARRLGLEPDTVRKRYEVARAALARHLGNAESV